MMGDDLPGGVIARHVLDLSGLSLDALSEDQEKALRRDIGVLLALGDVAATRGMREARYHADAVRVYLKRAELAAEKIRNFSAQRSTSIIEDVRKFQVEIEPSLRRIEDVARILERKLPRRSGRDEPLIRLALQTAWVFDRWTDGDVHPTTGNERPPGSRHYTSPYLNFLQHVVDTLGVKTRGSVKAAGNEAVGLFRSGAKVI